MLCGKRAVLDSLHVQFEIFVSSHAQMNLAIYRSHRAWVDFLGLSCGKFIKPHWRKCPDSFKAAI